MRLDVIAGAHPVECGIEHIFVFVGSLVLARRLCSLVESDEQAGSYRVRLLD